jgi:glycosyltransferase involved in cell wall biosynthesis
MNILFLLPYPLKESPSQRFRFEQYLEIIARHNHTFTIQSFLDTHTWRLFFKRGFFFYKVFALAKGFLRRFLILFSLPQYDFVFIHREASPIGPPMIEWLIANLFRKKIVYDFDDAIWLTDRVNEPFFLRLLKWRSKVKHICKWSYKVSCGNEYLCNYARQFNKRVIYNPTTIDTDTLHNPALYQKKESEIIIIGWTGSHSTLKYLEEINLVLSEIENHFPFVRLMVIADRKPNLRLRSLLYKPWSIQSEINDLIVFDIGIMPMPDDQWAKGKCGFKALQYMALQIPTVASPAGVNSLIVDHGLNGFLASSWEEWKSYLTQLICDSDLRFKLGKKGREKVIDRYSVNSNTETFLRLFE